jgi:hypothetical protein
MPHARSAFAVLLALALPGAVGGKEPTQLNLRPAAAPEPALRYRLLPELMDQEPGNAVEVYKQAIEALKKARKESDGGATGDVLRWLKLPADELPRDEARKLLDRYTEVFRLADRAARCESSDWRLVERVRQGGVETKFVEIPPTVELARLLALRARLAIVEGRTDQALHDLQTGLAAAKQIGDGPLFVCPLLGAAFATFTLKELELFLSQEKTPNLYWALTALPRPFLDLRKPLEGERYGTYAFFPGLLEAARDPNAGPLTPEQMKGCAGALAKWPLVDKGGAGRAGVALLIRAKHAGAKAALVAAGRPRDKVEQMPHVQVALLHATQQFDRQLDAFVKLQSLPYAEARQGLEEAIRTVSEERAPSRLPSREVPALTLSQPQMVKSLFETRAALDRQIAALRCVEAVRLYAAGHGGKLPAALADIKEVPVPHDPVTGKPFAYRLEGRSAALEGPATGGVSALAYELALKE